jgi:hypothetical protein
MGCTVRDQRFLPDLGLVTISTEGHRVDVRIEKDGTTKLDGFEIPDLAPNEFVQEARCGAWRRDQIVVALSVQQGESVSYHYALSDLGAPGVTRIDRKNLPGFVDPECRWFLSKALFTSTGRFFRIVAVNDHEGIGDGLEITFRRGWMKRIEDADKFEEKILFDSCGGYWAEPLQEGRAVLFETPTARAGASPR